MDLTTSLIGLGLVALTVLPIIYFYFTQKNKRLKFLNGFLSLAAQQQVKITRHALWGHYCAIGLDENSNKLFYLKSQDNEETKAYINLADVEKCRLLIHRRTQNKDQVIDRLELAFGFRNGNSPEKTLLFYSKEEDISLNGELQLAEQWQALISAQLVGNRRIAMAS
ncbi:MAG: hypothetical protein KY428_01235 [Bacteroidetes bacterium]|nr:hypothetical protein [Bacteroidota bacterium]